MLVSVIIPAYHAQTTIARAVRSVIAQTQQDWEAIIVSDDGSDYSPYLHNNGVSDRRLRFVSTGRIASGCHNARNVGQAKACGDYIAALDADDVLLPRNFELLMPLTETSGAAIGNVAVIADATGELLYRPFPDAPRAQKIDLEALLDLSVPLFPLMRRDLTMPRLEGIELAEDVVANLRLLDRIGTLPVLAETLSEYRVVTGSLCHNDNSADGFEHSYTALIERLSDGDLLGLSPKNAALAQGGLIRKREFNRAFKRAKEREPYLDFQSFAARERAAVR